jgi:hypothetical protein
MISNNLRARSSLADVRLSVKATLVLVALLTIGVALIAQTAEESPSSKTIAVNEGTDLAITVSPDDRTIVMDLQGMLYSLPIEGGECEAIDCTYAGGVPS